MSILLRTMMARMATRIIYEGVITSGDLHIATKDGEAMFFHDSIDFSSYAGTDGGSTPYRLVFTDSAGKVAIAYGGAAGGGEALGSELVTNGDFAAWTGDNPDGWVSEGTEDANNYITEDPAGSCRFVSNGTLIGLRQTLSAQDRSLYKRTCNVVVNTTGWRHFLFPANGGNVVSGGSPHTFYATYLSSLSAQVQFYRYLGAASDFTLDDVSVKKLTDVPATGLHLMSAKNGTTRNMTSVETGFDSNAIVGVKIYG